MIDGRFDPAMALLFAGEEDHRPDQPLAALPLVAAMLVALTLIGVICALATP